MTSKFKRPSLRVLNIQLVQTHFIGEKNHWTISEELIQLFLLGVFTNDSDQCAVVQGFNIVVSLTTKQVEFDRRKLNGNQYERLLGFIAFRFFSIQDPDNTSFSFRRIREHVGIKLDCITVWITVFSLDEFIDDRITVREIKDGPIVREI